MLRHTLIMLLVLFAVPLVAAAECGIEGDELTVCWVEMAPTTLQNEPDIARFLDYTRERLTPWCVADRCNAYPVIEITGRQVRVDTLHDKIEAQIAAHIRQHSANAKVNEWMGKTEIRERVQTGAPENSASAVVKMMTGRGLLAAATPADSNQPVQARGLSESPCGANKGYFKVCFTHGSTGSAHRGHWSSELREWLNDQDDEGTIAIVVAQAKDEEPYLSQSRGRAVKGVIDRTEGAADAGIVSFIADFEKGQVDSVPTFVMTRHGMQNAGNPFTGDPLGTSVRTAASTVHSFAGDLEDYDATQWTAFKESLRAQVIAEADALFDETRVCAVPLYSSDPFDLRDTEALQERILELYRASPPQTLPKCANDRKPLPGTDTARLPCTTYLLIDRTGTQFVDDSSTGTGGTHVFQSAHCGITPRKRDIDRADYGEEEIAILKSARGHTDIPDPYKLMLAAHGAITQRDETYGLALSEYASEEFDDICAQDDAERELREHCADPRDAATLGEILAADAKVIAAHNHMLNGEYEEALASASESIANAHRHFQGIGASIAIEAASRSDDCRTAQSLLEKYRSELRASQRLTAAQAQVKACSLAQLEETCEPLESDIERSAFNTHIVFVNDGLDDTLFKNAANTIAQRFLSIENIDEYSSRIDFSTMEAGASLTSVRNTQQLSTPHIDHRLLAQTKTVCKSDMVVVLSANEFIPMTVNGAGIVSIPACGYDESRPGSASCITIYSTRSIAHSLFRLPAADETVLGRMTRWGEEIQILERFNAQQRELIARWFGGQR